MKVVRIVDDIFLVEENTWSAPQGGKLKLAGGGGGKQENGMDLGWGKKQVLYEISELHVFYGRTVQIKVDFQT